MIDVIIFAVVSIFLLWKLKSILGKEEEGSSNTRSSNFSNVKDVTPESKPAEQKSSIFSINLLENKKDLKEAKKVDFEERLKYNLSLIGSNFEPEYRKISAALPEGVLEVKSFFDLVELAILELINAINIKSIDNLRSFCHMDLLSNFESLINTKKDSKEITQLVKIDDMQIISMSYEFENAIISIKVLSEQIKFTKEEDVVVSGSVNIPLKFTDILKFQKNCKNQNSGWVLVNIE